MLDALRTDSIDVAAACWARTSQDEKWSLYIATELVDREGPISAYQQVYTVLRGTPTMWIRESDVRLIGLRHPVSVNLREFQGKFPSKSGVWYQDRMLGDLVIEEAYIYPIG